jgi:hypothetical protein
MTTHASDALYPSIIQLNLCPQKVFHLATLSTLGRTLISRLAERNVCSGSEVSLCAVTIVEGFL